MSEVDTAMAIVAAYNSNASVHYANYELIGAIVKAIRAEREACAAIADELSNSASDHEAGAALIIAEKIRARGE